MKDVARGLAIGGLAAATLIGGCVTPGPALYDKIRDRAAFDFGCRASQVQVAELSTPGAGEMVAAAMVSSAFYHPNMQSQYGARGCGKRAVYKLNSNSFGAVELDGAVQADEAVGPRHRDAACVAAAQSSYRPCVVDCEASPLPGLNKAACAQRCEDKRVAEIVACPMVAAP